MVTFRDPEAAFEQAIAEGRLSADPTAPTHAGHFMYMGTTSEGDQFKHIITRQYLPDTRKLSVVDGVLRHEAPPHPNPEW